MKNQLLPDKFFLFACCISVLFICELLASYDLNTFFFFHLFISLAAAFLVYLFYMKQWSLRLPILNFFFTVALGPFGVAICLISLPLIYLHRQQCLTLPDIVSSYFYQDLLSPRTLLYERIVAHMEELSPDQVPPLFQNFMTFGTVEQKSLAIQKMLRYFSPSFVPLLKLGLQDPSNAIRVQAATALNSINHSFFQKFLSLEKQAANKEFDTKLLRQFADHSRIYAASQLADQERSKYVRQHGIKAYEKLAALEGLSNSLRVYLSQLYVVEKPEQAYQILEPILEDGKTPSEAYQYTIEALVKLKQFDTLRTLAARLLNQPNIHEYTRGLLALWSQGEHDALHITMSGIEHG